MFRKRNTLLQTKCRANLGDNGHCFCREKPVTRLSNKHSQKERFEFQCGWAAAPSGACRHPAIAPEMHRKAKGTIPQRLGGKPSISQHLCWRRSVKQGTRSNPIGKPYYSTKLQQWSLMSRLIPGHCVGGSCAQSIHEHPDAAAQTLAGARSPPRASQAYCKHCALSLPGAWAGWCRKTFEFFQYISSTSIHQGSNIY